MDSIRKTMQMHEDVFKHQVRQLHRLYSVQKMMMDELRNEIQRNRFWANQYHLTRATRGDGFHFEGDKSSRVPGDAVKTARGFHLERSASSGEAEPGSLMHSTINHLIQGSDKDTEVELTLSIGGSSRKKMASNSKPNSQLHRRK